MKKLTLLLLCCLTSMATWAVKADPKPVTITQPDGTQLTIRLNGDEDLHWYSTIDGVLLVQKDMAYYVAQVNADGSLSATSVLAHDAANRTEAELVAVATQDKDNFQKEAPAIQQRRMAKRLGDVNALNPSTTASPVYFPHTGTPKVLIILAQFSDTPFTITDPKTSFEDYFNGTSPLENRGNSEHMNNGSIKQYFSDMSNNSFAPQFDIVGPVTVSKGIKYYGGTSGNGNDEKAKELVTEACTLVDGDVDFSQYDSNGDGVVDLVYVLYAGYGQSHNGAPNWCIWPKAGSDYITKLDGKEIRRYGVSNELNDYPNAYATPRIEGIGLFCHEFSHTMGLPDLYSRYTSARIDNQAMERWDLMDEGEYLRSGYCPAPYTPWEKEVMEWTTIETLSGAQHVELQPGEFKKIVKDGQSQYLTILNIQKTGWYTYMPYHGLLVTRIDYKQASNNYRQNVSVVNSTDYPNDYAGKPGMTIVPADGYLITSYKMYSWKVNAEGTDYEYDEDGNKIPDGKTDYCCWSPDEYMESLYGDPFPGKTNVTQLLSVSLNDNVVIDDQPLYKITEDTETGIITFNFIDEDIVTSINSVIEKDTEGDNRIYDLSGRLVTRPQRGIYIQNGKKFVVK